MIAILPMRSGSKRVPGKNLRHLGGVPLFWHVLQALDKCASIEKVVLTSDYPNLSLPQLRIPVDIMKRPSQLASDRASMNEVISHVLGRVEGESFLQVHATSPFVQATSFEQAAQLFRHGNKKNSLFSVTRLQARLWTESAAPINHDPMVLLPTQDQDPLYLENSAFYLFTRVGFTTGRNRVYGTPELFPLSPIEAIDIDSEEDFELAQRIANSET